MSTYLYDEALLKKLKKWTSKSDVHVYGVNEIKRLFEVIADETSDEPIKLPLIALTRSRGYNIVDEGTTKRPLSYQGHVIKEKEFETYAKALEFCQEKNIDKEKIKPQNFWVGVKKFNTYELAEEYCNSNSISPDNIRSKTGERYHILNTDIHPDHGMNVAVIPISISYQLDVYTRYAKEADLLMRNLVFNLVNYPEFTIIVPKADLEHTAKITLNDVIEDNSGIPERFIEGNLTRLTATFTIADAMLWDTRKHHYVDIDIRMDDTYEREYSPFG